MIFQDDVLVYGATKEQFDRGMLAVKSQLREKNFTINGKKSNSKPVDRVSFLGFSISNEGIAPDPKNVEKVKNARAPTNNKQLESFAGLANCYRRIIPDFSTKILPLNNMRNSYFSWGKMQQKDLEKMKNDNPLVQQCSLQKKTTVTIDASEKPLAGLFRKKDIQSYMYRESWLQRSKTPPT